MSNEKMKKRIIGNETSKDDTDEITLIIISAGEDIASENIGHQLLELVSWTPSDEVEGCPTWACNGVRLWWRQGRQLQENNLDSRWTDATGEIVNETIHLTRHTSVSEQPMFTIHSFGNPQLSAEEKPREGGIAGLATPPSPNTATWYRALVRLASEIGMAGWATHLEATHRGPMQNGPAIAIELGSTEQHWRDERAAAFIAKLVASNLNLPCSKCKSDTLSFDPVKETLHLSSDTTEHGRNSTEAEGGC